MKTPKYCPHCKAESLEVQKAVIYENDDEGIGKLGTGVIYICTKCGERTAKLS